MRDTSPPPNRSGINKSIVLLLGGGMIFLIAAGVILFTRRAAPPKPPPEPPKIAEKINVPAPLVVSQPTRPLLHKEPDAGPVETTPKSQDNKKRRKRREKVGSIDTKQVNRYMNSHFSEVKACYERRLKVNSFLEGKLDLNIDVASTGKVTAISVNKDTVRDQQMLACVKRTIRRWQFPKPNGGRVIIGKTFNFKKKS